MPQLTAAKLYLESIHPALPWALLTLGVFLAIYASRKLAPKLWTWFDAVTPDGSLGHVVQGLPAVGLGALASVLLTGGDFGEAWKGAIMGALAPVLHLVLKALPVPYQGAVRAIATKAGIVGLVVLVLLGCCGCSSFLHWSPGTIPDVSALCSVAGPAVKSELEAIAAEYGVPLAFVEAAYQAACGETAPKDPDGAHQAGIRAARASGLAARRARARFLESDAGAE